jgi:dTDP-4-dehydrorhamnose 3,5-epimerase
MHTLPDGVIVRALTPHPDGRGNLVEIYREEWNHGWRATQLNAMFSERGVLRGVHVHASHVDYIVVIAGRMLLALHDLRPGSPTAGLSSVTELTDEAPAGVVIPAGVAHGFYFLDRSIVLHGMSRDWDPSDEYSCRWDAPELGLAWPTRAPVLSERDAAAGDYAALCEGFERDWAKGSAPHMPR